MFLSGVLCNPPAGDSKNHSMRLLRERLDQALLSFIKGWTGWTKSMYINKNSFMNKFLLNIMNTT